MNDSNERRGGEDRRGGEERRGVLRAALEEAARERRETITEFSELLFVVQEMGQRLATETHGDSYAQVRELNEKLHDVRLLFNRIEQASRG